MSSRKFRVHLGFLAVSAIFFVIEILIAYFGSGFIRHYIGDMLVVPLIYCSVRIFTNRLQRTLPLYVFAFAVVVESSQAMNIVDVLSIKSGSVLAIAIGSSFDWVDILCYAISALFCYLHTKLYV